MSQQCYGPTGLAHEFKYVIYRFGFLKEEMIVMILKCDYVHLLRVKGGCWGLPRLPGGLGVDTKRFQISSPLTARPGLLTNGQMLGAGRNSAPISAEPAKKYNTIRTTLRSWKSKSTVRGFSDDRFGRLS